MLSNIKLDILRLNNFNYFNLRNFNLKKENKAKRFCFSINDNFKLI